MPNSRQSLPYITQSILGCQSQHFILFYVGLNGKIYVVEECVNVRPCSGTCSPINKSQAVRQVGAVPEENV